MTACRCGAGPFPACFFDTVQLAALLYLTGGILNPLPFSCWPRQRFRQRCCQGVKHGACGSVAVLASLLAFYRNPLPWSENAPELPVLYIGGLWNAPVLATVFVTAYAGILARQSRQLAEGLAEARLTLEREQMVSLGALATAAAHKLAHRSIPLRSLPMILSFCAMKAPMMTPMMKISPSCAKKLNAAVRSLPS